jgi:hypothetical protein
MRRAVIVIAAVAVLAAIFAPITRMRPKGPCSRGPDSAGAVHRYDEVKPIAGV